jgi:hypothetical protein
MFVNSSMRYGTVSSAFWARKVTNLVPPVIIVCSVGHAP